MRSDDRRLVVGLHRAAPDRELIDAALEHGIDQIDTAYNYHGGHSHQLLRERVGPALRRLRISTKVGFFPTPAGRARHSLHPGELVDAVARSGATLGVIPEVVLLHNPERSLTGLAPQPGAQRLATACAALREATRAGWSQGWGISTWKPADLIRYLPPDGLTDLGTPDVLMIPCGLTVPPAQLHAGRHIAAQLAVSEDRVWGMSPFGGIPRDPVWTPAILGPFLPAGTAAAPLQVAFRVAYALPPVNTIAVGASTTGQLRQLIAATGLPINTAAIERYRQMLSTT